MKYKFEDENGFVHELYVDEKDIDEILAALTALGKGILINRQFDNDTNRSSESELFECIRSNYVYKR